MKLLEEDVRMYQQNSELLVWNGNVMRLADCERLEQKPHEFQEQRVNQQLRMRVKMLSPFRLLKLLLSLQPPRLLNQSLCLLRIPQALAVVNKLMFAWPGIALVNDGCCTRRRRIECSGACRRTLSSAHRARSAVLRDRSYLGASSVL